MSRTLGTDLEAAVSADAAEFIHLLELTFSDGTIRLSNGAVDIAWDGQTWQAVGGLIEIGPVEESRDTSAQGLDLRLSGVDQATISLLLNNSFRGYPAQLWRAHLNKETGALIGEPLLLYKGVQLDAYVIEESRSREGGTVRITTKLSGILDLRKKNGILSNVAGHGHYYPGDTFFQHTTALANAKIYWGTDVPRPVNGGTGGGQTGPGHKFNPPATL